jgi:hypothetical protein
MFYKKPNIDYLMIFNKEGSDLFFNKWGIRIQNPIKKSLFKNMIYELTYKIN